MQTPFPPPVSTDAPGLTPTLSGNAGEFLAGDGSFAIPADTTYTADETTLHLAGGTFAVKTGGIATAQLAAGAVTEGQLALADVTTDDVSSAQHGFAPKAPNDAAQFLNGLGAYSVPSSNAAAVTPSGISGLYAWWRAGIGAYSDAGVTLAADGDTIQQWNDQSGNGRHLSQATSGKRPTYKTGILNGLAVTRWAGGQCLQRTSFAVGTFTVLAVLKGTTTAGMVWELSATADANDGLYLLNTFNNTMVCRKGGVTSSRNSVSNWGIQGDWMVVTQRYNGSHATHALFMNSQFQLPGMATVTGNEPGSATTTDTLNVGARNNAGSLAFTGDLAELLIFTPAISLKNVRAVMQDLQGRYDL